MNSRCAAVAPNADSAPLYPRAPKMPANPVSQRAGFDVSRHLANTPVKIDYLAYMRTLVLMRDLQQFDLDDGIAPREAAQASARPAARVPFTPKQMQRAAAATGPSRSGCAKESVAHNFFLGEYLQGWRL